MVQKHHQQEISGPSDSIADAPCASELPPPKRIRVLSRKARENQASSSTSEVLSRSSPTVFGKTVPKRRQPSQRQQRSTSQKKQTQDRQVKEQWENDFESIPNKAKKLEILVNQLGSSQPYPQRLRIPNPAFPGTSLAHVRYSDPLALFSHFFPERIYAIIAENTNKNAWEDIGGEIREQRPWEDVTAEDIKGYIGALLLIGAQPGGRDLSYYWNTNDDQPTWPVAEYISKTHFQQITRYLKINEPEPVAEEEWWLKVEPLATAFRQATTEELYLLPQNMSIDEQLIQFKGRSKHTVQMNSKAAGQGYKLYTLCCPNGYMVDFRFTSSIQKVTEIDFWPGFTKSEAVVLDLAQSLIERFPRPQPFYVLHIDNFFTTRKLYEELYKRGIGANGTAKAGSGIPKKIASLKAVLTKQNHHGEWYNRVVGNVNCIGFCDMASSAMMTTIHDPTMENYMEIPLVKRPGASLKHAKRTTKARRAQKTSTDSTQAAECDGAGGQLMRRSPELSVRGPLTHIPT